MSVFTRYWLRGGSWLNHSAFCRSAGRNDKSPVARCGHHGLYIEMKAQDGRLSAVQKRWRDMLISQGYGMAVARSFEEAKQVLEDYLDDKWELHNEQFEQKSGD